MHIHLRYGNEAKRLRKAVRDYMRQRFILLPEHLDLLRCFEYDGQINGKQVKRISIFNPHKAQEKQILIRTRQDLEGYPEMLLYEGYIDSQGNAYVADRRAPIMTAKVARETFK